MNRKLGGNVAGPRGYKGYDQPCQSHVQKLVTHGIPQGSILGPIIFNVFISDLHNRTECTLSKFLINTKSGGEAGILEWSTTDGLDRLVI